LLFRAEIIAEQMQLTKKPTQKRPLIPKAKNIPVEVNKFIFPLLLFISCFILYGSTIRDGYALDDGIYTNKNDFIIKGFSAFKDIFDKGSLYGFDKNTATQYRPLTLLSFMAEVSIFGLDPHVSHFFNILLYAISVVLLYFFLQKILNHYNPAIIISATLLFAYHPIHTEVVANIKSRDEILGLLFGLISFIFIILYYEKHKNNYYFYSLLSFLAAIFCKENCLTFVLIIPLLLYFFSSSGLKEIVFKSLPYFGLIAFYLVIRTHVLQSLTFTHPIPVMDNALMSARNNADSSATTFVLLGKYIYMAIIPYPLSWDYSYNQIPVVTWGNIRAIVSLLVCVVMAGYMFWGFMKKSLYSFLIAWFFITLFLSSNLLIKIASTFGERFLYIPSLSFCIALPVVISKALKLNPFQLVWKRKTYYYIPILCIIIIYAIIVVPRNRDWENNYTLFSSGIITSPNSARAHLSLAQEYGEELKHSVSNEDLQRLFNLDVRETYKSLSIYYKYPEAYYNLGIVYFSAGMKDSAQKMFQKTLALKPGNAAAANNLGIIYAQNSDNGNALKWFTTALNTDSAIPGLLLNIGTLYQKTGDLFKAEYYYDKGLKMNHDDDDIKHNLFILYYNSGKDYFDKNEYGEALKQFELANQYYSQSAEVTGYLGAIYQSGNNYAKAEEYYRKSLNINPGNISIKKNLEMVMELQNRK
jgi:protein O-mannosyl-transferase